MGEVWRATDTRLSRDVAIKVLPAEVAADADRLARFRREAQLLASLNHQNIAAIHGIEEADGQPFLVLELVPGPAGPIARAFVRFENDAAPPNPPLDCDRAQTPRFDLYAYGTLTVNGVDVSDPTATHGHLVIDLPGGGNASFDF